MRLAVCLMAVLVATMALAQPPARVDWNASQFMVKAKVTRYLSNGSGIEHNYHTYKASKICNGWVSPPQGSLYQTCGFMLLGMEDLTYSYRIREYDRDGKQVSDSICDPLRAGWECRSVVRD